MNRTDRIVRAAVYSQFIEEATQPTAATVGARTGMPLESVEQSLLRLAGEHRLALDARGTSVTMAHPFSGVPTGYRARIGRNVWDTNCGWDVFAVLGLLGDGEALVNSPIDGTGQTWTVRTGTVRPGGLVHFVVPARKFWDDVEFT